MCPRRRTSISCAVTPNIRQARIPDGKLTATPEDITKVVQRDDANSDRRLQLAEHEEFIADFGERAERFA